MKQYITLVQNWWLGISLREQRLMIILCSTLALSIVFYGIFRPINDWVSMASGRFHTEKNLLNWVEEKAENIHRLRAQQGESASSLPLNQAVASTASQFGTELVRAQQRGDELQVWIQPMPFNRFIEWLVFLEEQHGISVTFVDLSEEDQEGMVDIKRLQFVKR